MYKAELHKGGMLNHTPLRNHDKEAELWASAACPTGPGLAEFIRTGRPPTKTAAKRAKKQRSPKRKKRTKIAAKRAKKQRSPKRKKPSRKSRKGASKKRRRN